MPYENKLGVAAGTYQFTQLGQLKNVQILSAPELATNSLLYTQLWVLTPLKDSPRVVNCVPGLWPCVTSTDRARLQMVFSQVEAREGHPGLPVHPSSWDLGPFPSCRGSVSHQTGPSRWRDKAGNPRQVHFDSCASSYSRHIRSPTSTRPWNPPFFIDVVLV